MQLDLWLAFVAFSVVMLAIPGPTVLLVVFYTLGYGQKHALAVVGGVALGGLAAMTTSMLGLGTVLEGSASVFTALRWAGGAYLIFLGITLWRTPVQNPEAEVRTLQAAPTSMFLHAFAVTALNPKGITFFVAFVPQFIVPAEPFLCFGVE